VQKTKTKKSRVISSRYWQIARTGCSTS